MGSSEPQEILISVLFSGTYLDEGSNIGHEIINFFLTTTVIGTYTYPVGEPFRNPTI